ncbi:MULTISPECIES: serine/threonine-protein kinase [unclassified Parafrankia]|uniref:WD40 repeat domain-containing serine/threonine protein kinase n=1 Tax=unclassified Parafrankia TaxID=2994368 RepID=UPI001404F89D|nr:MULTISPECIES: serine/threonine-protein kinase [unclassified Parafrankia]
MMYDRAKLAAALPGYTLGDLLGAGASGFVLAGWHRGLQRDVAVKVVMRAPGRRSFADEARILAGLDHPHVVRVYDYVEAGELSLLVMEMLSGGTLTRRRAGMTPLTACAVGLAVAQALRCVHDHDVLHRDIKPDNILFDTAGRLKVADFGIAKVVAGSGPAASTVVGTPLYMAPEQFAGGQLQRATDIYALGVVLFELLTGVAPADSASIPCQGSDGPSQVGLSLGSGIPDPVATVVAGALARDPGDRPSSAYAFAFDLSRAATEAFGPNWIPRSGVPVHVDHDLMAATGMAPSRTRHAGGIHVTPLPVEPGTPPQPPGKVPEGKRADPAPDDRAPGKAPADGNTPSGAGRDPAEPEAGSRGRARRGARRSPGRRLIVTAAVLVVLLGAVGTGLAVVLGRPDGARLLGHPLSGHTDWALSAVFSPDGQIMASSDKKGEVWLWDLRDRAAPERLGRPLPGPEDGVTSLAFSPDGRTLAGSDWNGTVWLWDVTGHDPKSAPGTPLTGHVGNAWSVAFSPDGKTLASGGEDSTVRLWDVADRTAPKPLGSLTGHRGYVSSVVFSRDGLVLAAAGDDSTVVLWQLDGRAAPRRLERGLVGPSRTAAAAFSPRGRVLALGGADGVIRLWDLAIPSDPRPVGRDLAGHKSRVWSLSFAPDGHTLASGSHDNTVRLWDVADLSDVRSRGGPLTGHADWVLSVRFSPDSAVLASASTDATVRLWSIP